MKQLINKLFCLGMLSFSLCGCSMFDAGLDNTYSESDVKANPAFAEGLLMKAYSNLPSSYSFSEVATDDAVSNDRLNSFRLMASGTWSSLSNPVSHWDNDYEAIAYLNKFLAIAGSVNWSWQSAERDSLFRQKLTGETYALRAFFHLRLLTEHIGPDASGKILGIPYIDRVIDATDNSQWNLQRPHFSETVSRIITDLDSAIILLPMDYSKISDDPDANRVLGTKFVNRITKRIALALKARTYMLAASPAFNGGQYDTGFCKKAADAAAALLNEAPVNGLNALISGVLKDPVFYDADADAANKDILWRQNYTTNDHTLETQNFPPSQFGSGNVNPSQNFVDAFPMANGYPISDPAHGLASIQDSYKNRDPRLSQQVIFNGGTLNKTTNIYTTLDSVNNPDVLNKQNNSTRTGYYLKKLLRPDVRLNPLVGKRHIYPLIRYTELVLIYAEAANEAYGPDNKNSAGFSAREAIRAIRLRAKVGGSSASSDSYLNSLDQSALRSLIRNERRIELSFEGFRFWDLRRWQLDINETAGGMKIEAEAYTPIEVEKRFFKDYMNYAPIPYDQCVKSSLLQQNAGW